MSFEAGIWHLLKCRTTAIEFSLTPSYLSKFHYIEKSLGFKLCRAFRAAFICPKSVMETPELFVKSVQS